ncbi:MAG: molybdopterin oxidoreductase, partial [Desulfobacteraceae bacterium]
PEQWTNRVGSRDPLLPLFQRVLPQSLVRAVLENDPYPLRAMYVHASNPLLTFNNSSAVRQALQNLDFLLVTDRFMTPTAALADVVLPAATYLEYDNIVAPPYYPIARIQQKAMEYEDCRSDFEMINGIARRLGLGSDFFENMDDFFNLVLEPSGLTFREFREQGIRTGARQAQKYLSKGFATASGKVELDSARLKDWGFDSLPVYREPHEASADESDFTQSYPLILTTQKSRFFRHSDGRQIESLREKHSDPLVWVHPAAAEKLAIRDGDWVYLETPQGRIKQKARFSEKIDPRVIAADFGWWFPEKGPEDLFNWAEANLNILTRAAPPFNAEMGSSQFRGIPCRIYKAEE